jgi:hypothetical protein
VLNVQFRYTGFPLRNHHRESFVILYLVFYELPAAYAGGFKLGSYKIIKEIVFMPIPGMPLDEAQKPYEAELRDAFSSGRLTL